MQGSRHDHEHEPFRLEVRVVGATGIEPVTSAMSTLRSYQLSYAPWSIRLAPDQNGEMIPTGARQETGAASFAIDMALTSAAWRSAAVTSTRSTPSHSWQTTWNASGWRIGRASACLCPQHSQVTMALITARLRRSGPRVRGSTLSSLPLVRGCEPRRIEPATASLQSRDLVAVRFLLPGCLRVRPSCSKSATSPAMRIRAAGCPDP